MLLKELHREFGNKWVKISNRMPGRSDNEVKNKFNSVYYRLSFQIAPLAKQPKRKRQKKKTRKNEKEPMKPKKTIASVPGSTLSISAMSSSTSSTSSTSSSSSSSSTSYNAGSDRASDKPVDTILGTLLPSLLLSPVYTPPVSSNITARSTNTSHNSGGGGTHTIKIWKSSLMQHIWCVWCSLMLEHSGKGGTCVQLYKINNKNTPKNNPLNYVCVCTRYVGVPRQINNITQERRTTGRYHWYTVYKHVQSTNIPVHP